jgi:hypothetical protein
VRARAAMAPVVALIAVGLAAAAPATAEERRSVPYISFTGSSPLDDAREFTFNAGGKKGRQAGIGVSIREKITWGSATSEFFGLEGADVTNRGVAGPIGDAGKARLRFVPTGPPKVRRIRCFHFERRPGVLEGRLRFAAATGGVDIDETRIETERLRFEQDRGCRSGRRLNRSHGGGDLEVLLSACNKQLRSLQVARLSDGRTFFSAMGPIRFERGLFSISYGSRRTRPGAFMYSKNLSSASLRPPAPFDGVGTFSDDRLEGHLGWTAPSGERFSMRFKRASLSDDRRRGCGVGIPVPVTRSSVIHSATRGGFGRMVRPNPPPALRPSFLR